MAQEGIPLNFKRAERYLYRLKRLPQLTKAYSYATAGREQSQGERDKIGSNRLKGQVQNALLKKKEKKETQQRVQSGRRNRRHTQ